MMGGGGHAEETLKMNSPPSPHSGKKKVEWIRRIPFHGVAALSAFGIEEGNPFRDCLNSLLIDLEG